ncbi:unnamed protein product [Rotaria sp. Silwood1]|nr:unnamed protein product [Rotaria sp. Silwood1]
MYEKENSEDNHERIKLTSLAAQTAEHLLNTNKSSINGTTSTIRLEQSVNDEKLQLIEDNRLMENNICENHLHENKSLENCQPNELNNIDETIEREKQELQKKLNLIYYQILILNNKTNTNIQIRLLQMKHEFDEKLRNVENRYKNEIENLTGCYEQITVKNDTLEKRLTEVLALSLTLFF